jgi:hypothetical protein
MRAVTPPAAPPPDLLDGMRAGAPLELRIVDVVADAAGDASLTSLLEDAGFATGIERGFSGGVAEVRRVDVWILRFGTPEGADRYTRWLSSHVDDVIGKARVVGALKIPPGTVIHLHRPSGCCPKETNVALATWLEGDEVVRVLIAGPGASKETAISVALAVHAWRESSG